MYGIDENSTFQAQVIKQFPFADTELTKNYFA